ncbi:hypothetical protein PUN28_002197 [Cardiocondyla obscurior]|uniref:ATP synthase F0 subunit 8 n=1 Tax=Cardiocondyla obscurior TaxID=286306 RepID=A0AAW2GSY0_9HYME
MYYSRIIFTLEPMYTFFTYPVIRFLFLSFFLSVTYM